MAKYSGSNASNSSVLVPDVDTESVQDSEELAEA